MEEETDGQETGLAESDNPLILGTWSGLFYGADLLVADGVRALFKSLFVGWGALKPAWALEAQEPCGLSLHNHASPWPPNQPDVCVGGCAPKLLGFEGQTTSGLA